LFEMGFHGTQVVLNGVVDALDGNMHIGHGALILALKVRFFKREMYGKVGDPEIVDGFPLPCPRLEEILRFAQDDISFLLGIAKSELKFCDTASAN